MRKIACVFLLMSAVLSGRTQTWFDIGLKAEGGLNLLINSNISNDADFTYKPSGGYGFGAKLGVNFGDHEVTFDGIYSRFNQNWQVNILDTASGGDEFYDKNFYFNAFDLILMYRYNNPNGSYVEIGPQWSVVMSAGGSNTYAPGSDGDIASKMVNGFPSAVIGFGQYMFGTENFGITTGLRFKYALGDMFNDPGTYPSPNAYDSYAPSNTFSAMFVIEFNYDLGYMARAQCKQRTKLVLF